MVSPKPLPLEVSLNSFSFWNEEKIRLIFSGAIPIPVSRIKNLTDELFANVASRSAFGDSYSPGTARNVIFGKLGEVPDLDRILGEYTRVLAEIVLFEPGFDVAHGLSDSRCHRSNELNLHNV